MDGPASQSRGVSARAVSIGLICCLAIAMGEPYGVLVLRGSPMAADFSAGAAIFIFFILTLLINPLAKILTGSALRTGELATIYIMMIVACAIPSWGFTMNLIPLMAGFFYYATPENEWISLIQPHLPVWLIPDEQDAIWQLFEGGTHGAGLPWATWLIPLCSWGLFVTTLYCVSLCLLVMLRKQWVERERLLFPLATLPMEMSQQTKDKFLPAIFRNYLTWVGFSLPFLINLINGLHAFYNFIPRIDLNLIVPIMRNSVYMNCTPRFEVIGLAYLLSLDVSFGVWFFAFLALLQTGIQRMLGWSIGPIQPFSDPAPPSVAHIALGALFFLVFSSFWNSREHLRDVFRKAFRGDESIDDSGELLSYRAATFGATGGFGLCLIWLTMAGMNLPTALVFLLSSLVIFIGLARIVSQTGLAYGRATVCSPVFTVNTMGSAVVGPAGLTALGLNFAWSADIRTFVMASAATGLKLAEVTRLESRRLFWAIILAIIITLCGSAYAVIELSYQYGGINLSGWQFNGLPSYTGNWISRNIKNPEPVQFWHLGFTGIGALLMGILTFIKARFVGFPIHPIGLTLGLTHPVFHVWFSVFIAWLCKALILKYGGAFLYTRLRPLFLGSVLGAFGSAGFWLIVSWFTGVTGLVFILG